MFPALWFFRRVWELLALIFLYMCGRIHQWNHLVLGLLLLEGFWMLIQSPYLLICSNFLFLHESVLVHYLYISRNLSISSMLSNLLGEIMVKGYKLLVIRWVSFEDLVYNMVIIVNNTSIVCLKDGKRVYLKCSHHALKIW